MLVSFDMRLIDRWRLSAGADILQCMGQSPPSHLASLSKLIVRNVAFLPAVFAASGAADLASSDERRRVSPARLNGFGGWVAKTMTRVARPSNPQPVVVRWGDRSLVNSVGLANPGADASCARLSSLQEILRASPGLQTIISIAGAPSELHEMITMLEAVDWIAGYEINLSCPNTGSGVIPSGNPAETAARVAAVRDNTSRPVFAKLGPACSDVAEVSTAAQDAGADALVVGNTMPVRPMDDQGHPILGAGDGGLSGRGLHDINLRLVAHAAQAVAIPVIGCGGIAGPQSAQRMINCGAQGIQIGTALQLEPDRVQVLMDELVGH